MLLTIAVVTYNCEKLLADTLQSIKSFISNWPGEVEVISIDGGSTDNTTEVIKGSGLFSIIVSEPDDGIFDAMNKACHISTGEWICYMNAGDSFMPGCANEIYSALNSDDLDSNCAVLYGDTLVYFEDGSEFYKAASSKPSFNNYMPFCHQSAFTRRHCIELFRFDTRYPRVADQKLYLDALSNHMTFKYCNIPVSRVMAEGFSNAQIFKTKMEEIEIKVSYGLIPKRYAYIYFSLSIMSHLLKKISPNWLVAAKRRYWGV